MLLLLSILLCAAILYYGQDRLYRACWRKGLSVKLELSDEKAVEGSVLTLTETVSNRKLLPLPLVHIKFVADRSLVFEDDPHASVTDYYYRNDIMTVLSWQRLYRTLSFTCTRRGYYTFRELTATCGNLFFNTNQLAGFPCGKTLCVYPRYVDPSVFDPTFCRMLGSVLTRRFLNEDPFEFRSIRDYQSYDDRKSVNWKASARTGALKVTTHDYTAAQQVRILINLEEFSVLRHDHLLEEGIRLAATAEAALLNRGIQVSLLTNGRDIISRLPVSIPGGSGPGHLKTIREALARIDLSQTAGPAAALLDRIITETRAQDYLILISSYQKEDMKQQLRMLPGGTDSFLWIFPCEEGMDPEVGSDLSSNVILWPVI